MNNDFKLGLKIGVVDIETTSLDVEMGTILGVCVKEVNPKNMKGKIHTLRIDSKGKDKFNDKKLLEKLVPLLDSFDVLLGWYSSRFDFPYINAKCLHYNIKCPDKNYRRDLLFCVRASARLRRNALGNWGKWLFGSTLKTYLDKEVWKRAQQGDNKAIDYIVDHCQYDVIETERIYKRTQGIYGKLRRR